MKRILFILLALIPLSAIAQQPEYLRLTLEECIDLAHSGNYNRQSVALDEDAQEDLYKQAKQERLPDLTASVGESYSHSKNNGGDWNGNYSVSTGITLYQGGQINNTIEKNKLTSEQAAYRTAQYDNELTIQVLQAFLTALGNEELLRYQQSILNASEEQVRQGELRLEAGEIIESDYLLLEAQYASDSNNILETKINRDNSLDVLKSLMSFDLSMPIEILYPDEAVLDRMGILPSEGEVVFRSMGTLPDLRISDYNVKIAEKGLQISRSAYAPTLSMNAGIGSGHSNGFSGYGSQLNDKLNEQVGLALSVPIFNRNRTKSNVTQSRIALQKAELERAQNQLDIEQVVIQEYRNVLVAESRYKSSDILRYARLASFDAYRTKFEEGAITAVELLQQQNNYISAMNDYIQDKYGFMLKRKILDVYMGEPVTM